MVSRACPERRRGRSAQGPVYATRHALAAPERAGVPGVLEERVREALAAGRKRHALPGLGPRTATTSRPLDAEPETACLVFSPPRAGGSAALDVSVGGGEPVKLGVELNERPFEAMSFWIGPPPAPSKRKLSRNSGRYRYTHFVGMW